MPKGGGAAGRKRRHEILDRLARQGSGLSPGQKNDWEWFKQLWDDAMLAEHKAEWANVFGGWVTNVLNDVKGGDERAFSKFVHSETVRVLSGLSILSVPH